MMSETIIDRPETDLYKEHSKHLHFQDACSECFAWKKRILRRAKANSSNMETLGRLEKFHKFNNASDRIY